MAFPRIPELMFALARFLRLSVISISVEEMVIGWKRQHKIYAGPPVNPRSRSIKWPGIAELQRSDLPVAVATSAIPCRQVHILPPIWQLFVRRKKIRWSRKRWQPPGARKGTDVRSCIPSCELS